MTRCLYLHGFASGPRSSKGRAFAADLARRGVTVELLDLRTPSLERLSHERMIEHVLQVIADQPAVLVGSSLGGLTAARVACRTPAVKALVLLAPAFDLLPRWRARLGDDGWRRWQQDGSLEVLDHTTGQPARVHWGFAESVARCDAVDGGRPQPSVPAWVAHGRAVDVVDVARSRAWVAEAPDRSLLELDDDHQLLASLPTILPGAAAFLAPFLADR